MKLSYLKIQNLRCIQDVSFSPRALTSLIGPNSREALTAFGITDNRRKDITIISCSGKWTIPPFANLLGQFGIPFRIVHDTDAKGRSTAQLAATIPIDPYRANARIAQFAAAANVHQVNDTLEDILWLGQPPSSSGDKPFRAWRRFKEISEDQALRQQHLQLGQLLAFVFP